MAYAPCGSQHKDAVQVTLEQIDLIKRLAETYSNQLRLVKTSEGERKFISFDKPNTKLNKYFFFSLHAEIVTAHAENRIASLVTVESGHAIGTSLAVLRMFHRLGARQAKKKERNAFSLTAVRHSAFDKLP